MSKSTRIDRHQDYCECGTVKQKRAKMCIICYNKKRSKQKEKNKKLKRKNLIEKYNLQKNEKIDYSDEYLKELKRRDPNRICYIYKITNLINGKLYIGLTTNTIQERWYYHLKDLEKKKSALYNAMNKYGVKNFKIEEIEQCTLSNVREREKYWIGFYNTYLDDTKGYNQSAGGELCILKTEDEKDIVELYNKYQNITLVANKLHADRARIVRVLSKNDIEIKTAREHKKDTAYSIFQYDKNDNLIQEFQSKYEAGQWAIDNKFSNAKNSRNAGDVIRRKIFMGETEFYGYKWKLDENYPQKSIENFIKRYNTRNKVKKNNSNTLQPKKIPQNKTQKINKIKNKTNKPQKENSIKPISREELKSLIRTTSFSEIGRTYNVTDNTIKKWCKFYNLPFRKLDIDKISDKNWENENWNLKQLEEFKTNHHANIKPCREQLKEDIYKLDKKEIKIKYDLTDEKQVIKFAKDYNLEYRHEIIIKCTYDEWIDEKWQDENFLNYLIKNRYSIKYPERNWFKKEIRARSFKDISSDFNVDKSTIKKILIYFNLPYYREDILSYTNEEWENEIWNNAKPTAEKGGQADE